MATTSDFSQDLMIHLGTLNRLVVLHQNIAHKLGEKKNNLVLVQKHNHKNIYYLERSYLVSIERLLPLKQLQNLHANLQKCEHKKHKTL